MPNRRKRMQFTIDIPDDTVRCIQEHSAGAKSDLNPLALQHLLDLVAEEVGLSVTRPGSWEGAKMRDVLRDHRYPWSLRIHSAIGRTTTSGVH